MSDVLKTTEGVASAVIALYVAFLGTMQWRVARDKVRLDLYNRRFDIYVKTVDFMQALIQWQVVPESERFPKRIAFIRAVRESRFLFADDPSLLNLLEELNTRSFKVTGFVEFLSQFASTFPDQYIQSYEDKQQNLDWIMEAVGTLEAKLVPYLAFDHRIRTRKSTKNLWPKRL